jgi:hypothetical protein
VGIGKVEEMILESIVRSCPSLRSELEPELDLRLGHGQKGNRTHKLVERRQRKTNDYISFQYNNY